MRASMSKRRGDFILIVVVLLVILGALVPARRPLLTPSRRPTKGSDNTTSRREAAPRGSTCPEGKPEVTMPDRTIGYRDFVDGSRRPIDDDGRSQYVINDEGQRVHGLFMIPEEERCDLPVIVDAGALKDEK